MRDEHLERHFDIDNDGELDFMENAMYEQHVWDTFHSEEEIEEDEEDFCDDYDDFGDGGDDW